MIPTTTDIITTGDTEHKVFAKFTTVTVDSTASIEISLPCPDRSVLNDRNYPHTNLDKKSTILVLHDFKISCSSANYDISLINKYSTLQEDLQDTIFEVYSQTGINKKHILSHGNLSLPLFIRNYNVPADNIYYIYFENNGASSGIISIEFIYSSLASIV